jgi:hypothetical protein
MSVFLEYRLNDAAVTRKVVGFKCPVASTHLRAYGAYETRARTVSAVWPASPA